MLLPKQKAEEKRKVEEKRQEEEWLHLLKEKQEAEEKQRLVELKAKADEAAWLKDKEKRDKEIVDATVKKKQKKKQKKKAKAVMESGSEGEVQKIVEATLAEEEKGTKGDTEERPRTSKNEALRKLKVVHDGKQRATGPAVSTAEKRKRMPKLSSIVESSEEGTSGPSKRVKLEVMGPMEGEEEFTENSK